MHRRLLLALPAALFVARPAAAAVDVSGAASFVNKMLTEVLAVINSGAPDMQTKVEALLDAGVDVAGIAQFCAGRFWRTATPAQQAEYRGLFRTNLLKNILGRVGEFKGTSFEPASSVAKDDAVYVGTTLIRPGNAPNKVEWVVADVGGPKVIDVVAEGASLRLTQRSDYAAFLGRNGGNLGALIEAMRKQVSG